MMGGVLKMVVMCCGSCDLTGWMYCGEGVDSFLKLLRQLLLVLDGVFVVVAADVAYNAFPRRDGECGQRDWRDCSDWTISIEVLRRILHWSNICVFC